MKRTLIFFLFLQPVLSAAQLRELVVPGPAALSLPAISAASVEPGIELAPAAALSALPTLSAERGLLAAPAAPAPLAAPAKTLPRTFVESAKRNWGRLAFADSTGKELSYGKALTGAALVAGLLKKELPEGTNVGVLLPPTAGGALANIGLGMAGRVPVNLNYTASEEAYAHALSKAGIKVTITSRRFVDGLKQKLGRTPPGSFIYLEDLLEKVPAWKQALTYIALRVLPASAIEALWLRKAARSLGETATILFTSGSSALPKGVVLSHGNIGSNVAMIQQAFGLQTGDVVLGALPFFHSFGYTATLWFPALSGIAAAYHTHPLETDPIGAAARKYGATILLGTPTFLARYAQKIAPDAFSKLRLVVAGAEKLRTETADAFEKRFGIRPLEGYGATELSPVAAVNLPGANKPGSVGRPLPGVEVRTADPDTGAPVEAGKPGMLLVRGPNVMKGYLDEPAKTAEALKDGWYVTGDIAVIDSEGYVTLVGRLSRFTKIAGEMVSHVAVEDKLNEAAGASEQTFVVTGVPDEARGERLVVLYSGWDGELDALIEKVRALGLPRLWTPSKQDFHKVDAIPALGTGKLDLKGVNELARRLSTR
jgi:acyl-[acyl-carrier-protein]-phospholipid O-acyltransferase/long-chain-fatty-acid--[acyl-carrier-protein] ligase